MQITEKQKQQLIDLNDSRVNEILNFGLKVGEWYKDLNEIGLYYITEIKEDRFYFLGFDVNGHWIINDWYLTENCVLSKATKQEVEEKLIAEAKQRGYENGNYKCLLNVTQNVQDKYFIDSDNCIWHGIQGWANLIFEKGKWSEIIDEKSELKQEIKEL